MAASITSLLTSGASGFLSVRSATVARSDRLESGPADSFDQGPGSAAGVAYMPETDRLVVANDRDGRVNIYQGKNFEPAGAVDLQDDADNVRYDAAAKRIYVGYGSGALGLLDPEGAKMSGSIPLAAHPESFQLEEKGPRIL